MTFSCLWHLQGGYWSGQQMLLADRCCVQEPRAYLLMHEHRFPAVCACSSLSSVGLGVKLPAV